MSIYGDGRAPWRVILVQVLLLSGLLLFFKFYLPYRERQSARQAVVTREQGIVAFFHDSVETDSDREISVPFDGELVKRHPERLRSLFSPRDAEAELGVPDATATDFSGGQHLTWVGTAHKLEISFNAGRLYCIALEDRGTGHGSLVYASYQLFHPY